MNYEKSAGIITYFAENSSFDDREYLILRYEAGHWDFPKGIIEPGETEIEGASRELMEEAGLEAQIDSSFRQIISYLFKNKMGQLVSKEVIFFVGRTNNKEVTLSDEHIDYAWLTFNDALEKLTYTNAKQLLVLADQHIEKTNK